MQVLNLMGLILSLGVLDFPLKLTAETRNFKEMAASKKEDQKLENTSNQYFFDKTFQRKKPASERRFDQKHEKFWNQYFCNKILKGNL